MERYDFGVDISKNKAVISKGECGEYVKYEDAKRLRVALDKAIGCPQCDDMARIGCRDCIVKKLKEIKDFVKIIKNDTGDKPKKWFQCPNCERTYEIEY